MNEYIKSDLYRYTGDLTFSAFIYAFLRIPAFRYMCAHRLINSSFVFEKAVGKIMWFFRDKRWIQIPKETKIGYGLYIGHSGPIIISPSAVIGDNCNLSQFTTIGANNGSAAHIGNCVYIGPNCCVVEDIEIGDNVTIGAGSIVTKNISDNATAVGNYARVISFDNPGRYINNRWIRKE